MVPALCILLLLCAFLFLLQRYLRKKLRGRNHVRKER